MASNDTLKMRNVRDLAAMIGIEASYLSSMVAVSSRYYRSFSVPKRNGGLREISMPSPSLLYVQRWINKEILASSDISGAAHGFIIGRSVITNASVHLGQPYLMKLDLRDFYGSIKLARGISVFTSFGFAPKPSYILASLCFLNQKLPQGAATSPALSNIILKRLDKRLIGVSAKHGMKYSRYADDLCFSSSTQVSSLLPLIHRIIDSEGLDVNKSKLVISGPGEKKIVTGISITNGRLSLPRSSIREIKQEVFYILKYGYFEHVARRGNNDPILIERLLGRLSFWLHIDPANAQARALYTSLQNYRSAFDIELGAGLEILDSL